MRPHYPPKSEVWSHYRVDSGMWEFVLVTAPIEKIWVVTRRGVPVEKKPLFEGYRAMLGVGDRVYFKANNPKYGPKWHLKFRLCLFHGRPSIKYGSKYGPRRGRFNSLKRLPWAAFENAGIDPAWIKEAP